MKRCIALVFFLLQAVPWCHGFKGRSLAPTESLQPTCASLQFSFPGSSSKGELTNIFWLHIPKAGTSFLSTIWNYACGQTGPPLDLRVDSAHSLICEECFDFALMERYSRRKYCKLGVLSRYTKTQHLPIRLEQVQARHESVVGMFRKPSQRLISAFRNGMHANGFSDEEFQQLQAVCGHTARASCYAHFPGIAGCTARMLTGGKCAESFRMREGRFDGGQSRLQEALKALDSMAFVGLTERWEESVCLFHRMFGGRINNAEFLNVHEGFSHHGAYAEEELEGFRDEVDDLIYEAAKRRFEADLANVAQAIGSLAVCEGLEENLGNRSQTEESQCSCSKMSRQCGVHEGRVDCGACPVSRLSADVAGGASCDENRGLCLVQGKPNEQLFRWKGWRASDAALQFT